MMVDGLWISPSRIGTRPLAPQETKKIVFADRDGLFHHSGTPRLAKHSAIKGAFTPVGWQRVQAELLELRKRWPPRAIANAHDFLWRESTRNRDDALFFCRS